MKSKKKYTDSLNNWNGNERLPSFIDSIHLDGIYSLWAYGVDDPHSFRKAIIDNVTNIKVLYKILSDKDPNYDKKPCDHYDANNMDIPYCDYSLKDLVKLRLKNLQN